jgi:ubiquinone/menaquinone biosynthesis C-methylase UbiE
MAERVGPSGRVTGIDVDTTLGAQAEAMLHAAGHGQCRFVAFDATASGPIPGAPFDLVYARLLIFHMPDSVAALRRLWDAVALAGSCSSTTTTCAGPRPCPHSTASTSSPA